MSNQVIKPITRNVLVNKASGQVETAVAVLDTPTEVERPISVLANQFTFEGEYLSNVNDGVSMDETISYAVYQVNSGETTKAQGVFVAASKLAGIGDTKEAKVFTDSLRARFVLEAKEEAISAFVAVNGPISDSSPKPLKAKLEACKKSAEDAAGQRFNNLQQSIATAVLVTKHPELLPTHKSVFKLSNYTQAKRFLLMPADDAKDKDEVKAVRSAVLPLLKAGASQTEIKAAMTTAKDKLAKEAEKAALKADTRTPEQKAKDEHAAKEADLVKRVQYLATKIGGFVDEWNVLMSEFVARGNTMAETQKSLASQQLRHDDANGGTMASKIKALAILAGLEVK